MSKEIVAILDHEGLGPKVERSGGGVVAIAHDWGTYLLSQLASRYQARFEKFVFMSVPYTIPGRKTDVEIINKKTKERFGYEMLGYFLFLSTPRAGKILGENVRSACLVLIQFWGMELFVVKGGQMTVETLMV
jgi:pimeloyl-ACP methyl ester carboxylesterase